MFERNFSDSGFEQPAKTGALRPLVWSEVSARLAAAHELRSATRKHRKVAAGNFARFTSTPSGSLNENTAAVNPDALADGKCSGANVPDTAIETQSGDRES